MPQGTGHSPPPPHRTAPQHRAAAPRSRQYSTVVYTRAAHRPPPTAPAAGGVRTEIDRRRIGGTQSRAVRRLRSRQSALASSWNVEYEIVEMIDGTTGINRGVNFG